MVSLATGGTALYKIDIHPVIIGFVAEVIRLNVVPPKDASWWIGTGATTHTTQENLKKAVLASLVSRSHWDDVAGVWTTAVGLHVA